jgi:hypothetical protein
MQTTRIRPTDRVASRRALLGLAIHLGFVTQLTRASALWQHGT